MLLARLVIIIIVGLKPPSFLEGVCYGKCTRD